MSPYAEVILAASQKHPKPEGKIFKYGTAGFRMNAQELDSVVFRSGLLAALCSRARNGETIGVMIIASHNPAEDNGLKLIDPMGEMLDETWEAQATEFANAPSDEALLERYQRLLIIRGVNEKTSARVFIARDTRPSGDQLLAALLDGLNATQPTDSREGQVKITDFGLLTTPQIHYLVRAETTKDNKYPYGTVNEEGYYKKLATAFGQAMEGHKCSGSLTVDCANGIGAPKLALLMEHLPSSDVTGLKINIVNNEIKKPSTLNHNCGADFVKSNQRPPRTSQLTKLVPEQRYASLDGDADRIIYYFQSKDSVFRLLDGDRIATLAASFLGNLVRTCGLSNSENSDHNLSVGVVQTAYANGAATKYVKEFLKLEVVCTATGVKHLHHAAKRFDIGVYFEANGHGTVIFSDRAVKLIREKYQPKTNAQNAAFKTLTAMLDLINQAVGDALSDLLLVEVILAHQRIGPTEWVGNYADFPNRLCKAKVANPHIFETTDSERRLSAPRGIQDQIDALVRVYVSGRSFARPSGTEDVVRVYAEAQNKTECDTLALAVVALVENHGAMKS